MCLCGVCVCVCLYVRVYVCVCVCVSGSCVIIGASARSSVTLVMLLPHSLVIT